MARYTGPKEKLERRIGQKLFLKGERSYSPKAAMIKKPYPPGMHGPKSFRRLSEFGGQLIAKQKIRYGYKILEKQFKNYIKEALRSKANSNEILVSKLESRLDNVIFKCGLANARDLARQLINHGHILVNQRRVHIPSFQTKAGDIVSLSPLKLKSKRYFTEILPQQIKKHQPPSWLELDKDKLTCKIIGVPNINESGIDLKDLRIIIEFYSR